MIFTFEHGVQAQPRTGWSAVGHWFALAALGVFGVLIVIALFVAFTAAAVVGLIIAAAMLLLRLALPGKREEGGGDATLLEGRRTAEGWVVEAETRSR